MSNLWSFFAPGLASHSSGGAASITPSGIPSKPTLDSVVTGGEGEQVVASWTPAVGGAVANSYELVIDNDPAFGLAPVFFSNIPNTQTTFTFNKDTVGVSLPPSAQIGVNYWVGVQARNSAGVSGYDTGGGLNAAVINLNAPANPIIDSRAIAVDSLATSADEVVNAVTYAVGYGSASVPAATAPGDYPNSITGLLAPSTSLVGLNADTTYYVRWFAKGDGVFSTQWSDPSAEISETTASAPSVPDTPTLASPTPQPEGAGLSWSYSGDPPITSYSLRYGTSNPPSESPPTNGKLITGIPVSTTSYSLNESTSNALDIDNAPYYVQIGAVNAQGTTWSATGSSVTPTQLRAPANVTITSVGASSIGLSWDIVANDQGYKICWDTSTKANASANYANSQLVAKDATSGTITGLDAGVAYYIRVYAQGLNEGTGSAEVTDSTEGAPDAPTLGTVTASANGEQISVAFTGAGTPVTEDFFQVQYDTVNTFDSGSETILNAASSPKQVYELDHNNTYYFRVRGVSNTYGPGDWTSASAGVSPNQLPAPGSAAAAAAGTDRVDITANAVTNADTYTVEWNTGTPASTAPYSNSATGLTLPQYSIGSLSPSTNVKAIIYGVGVNAGVSSSEVEDTTAASASGPPLAPTLDTAAANGSAGEQVDLTWTAPASGTAPDYYEGQWDAGSSAFNSPDGTQNLGTGTSGSLVNLAVANQHVRIRGISNTEGAGAWSNVYSTVRPDPLHAPANPEAAGTTSTTVSTSADAVTNALTYRFDYSTGTTISPPADGPPYDSAFTGLATPSKVITGLTGGTIVKGRWTAVGASTGDASSQVSAETPNAATVVPGAPQSPSAAALAEGIQCSWTAPVTGDSPSSYTLQYDTDSGFGSPTTITGIAALSQELSFDTGHPLAASTAVYFRVAGVNVAGTGTYSASANATPTALAAPGNQQAAASSDTTATLSWDAATHAQSYRVGYGLSSQSAGPSSSYTTTKDVAGTITTLTGLTAEQTYYARAYAVGVGEGSSPTAELTFTTPASGTGDITISVDVNGVTNPAVGQVTGRGPFFVLFNAWATTGSNTPYPGHELSYVWDFGDSTNHADTSQTTWVTGHSRNASVGPNAAHVFGDGFTARNYTVVLTVRDNFGNIATKNIDITSTAWSPSQVVFVSNGTDFTGRPTGYGAGSGSTTLTTSSNSAIASAIGTNKYVCLKRGDSFSGGSLTAPGTGPSGYGAWGTGALPTVTTTGDAFRFDEVTDFRCGNIHFIGPAAVQQVCWEFNAGANSPSSYMVFHNCDVDYYDRISDTGAYTSPGDYHNHIGYFDIRGLNYANEPNQALGITLLQDFAFLGIELDLTDVDGHGIRTRGRNGIIAHNRIYNNRPNKACIKLFAVTFTSGEWYGGHYTEKVTVYGNHATVGGTGGDIGFSIQPQGAAFDERHRDIVVDSNLVDGAEYLGAGPNGAFIQLNCERGTIRNNIINHTVSAASSSGIALDNKGGSNIDPGTGWVYNNTHYANGVDRKFIYANPAISTTPKAYNNLDWSPSGTVTFFSGASFTQNNNVTASTNPFASASPSAAADFQAQAGSDAENAGVKTQGALIDFDGSVRANPPEAGAWEV